VAQPLFSGLLQPNALVTIQQERSGEDAVGGNTVNYVTLAEHVPVLLSLFGGARDGRFASRSNTTTARITGESPFLGRPDTRIYFETGQLAGEYAEAVNVTGHAETPDGWIPARYSVQVAVVQV